MKLLKIIVSLPLFFLPALLLYLHLTSPHKGWATKEPSKKVFVNPVKKELRSYNLDNNIPNPDTGSNLDLDAKVSLSNVDSTISIDSSIIDEFSSESLNYQQSTANISKLEPIYKAEPVYPQSALMRNIEGWVKLKIDIKSDGEVTNIRIIQSYPPRIFNRSAKRAVSSWKYEKSTNGKKNHIVELKYILN